MLRVITVKAGPKYGPEYANKLCRMVTRHLNVPHMFVCLTDDPTGLECLHVKLWRDDLEGWWNKMLLFDPLASKLEQLITTGRPWHEGDRLLLLDLDIVIVGSIIPVVGFDSDFAMHRDFMTPRRMASAVMLLKAGSRPGIWERFMRDKAIATQSRYGDQAFIDKHAPDVDVFPRRWIVSYKLRAQRHPPDGARIVCFHGQPKPHECGSWVTAAWG